EQHAYLGDPAREPLAGPQVERNAGPAARLDTQPYRSVCFGGRVRRDAVFGDVRNRALAGEPTLVVLPADRVGTEVGRERDRPQDLEFLGADRLSGELDRLLHRGEREQLEEVVL